MNRFSTIANLLAYVYSWMYIFIYIYIYIFFFRSFSQCPCHYFLLANINPLMFSFFPSNSITYLRLQGHCSKFIFLMDIADNLMNSILQEFHNTLLLFWRYIIWNMLLPRPITEQLWTFTINWLKLVNLRLCEISTNIHFGNFSTRKNLNQVSFILRINKTYGVMTQISHNVKV